jgi:hypothetical protein
MEGLTYFTCPNTFQHVACFRVCKILEADEEALDAESFFYVAAKSMEEMKESFRTLDMTGRNVDSSAG